ncbi:MAG: universal stress protein [Candidatus Omnitrophica bacterium]|nr:universal stress protein [Candidatus Omnitrophota bacterium]MCM8777754.1 universal stress protein [Candidatus Omnitrophota bacterium]
MFEKILVATDLSSASEVIVNYIGELRKIGTKECVLVQCIKAREAASYLIAQDAEILKSAMEKQKKVLEKQGFTVTVEIAVGTVHTEVNRIAKEQNCSLIVIGSHGHSLAGEIFLGGVATNIIHNSVKPVLIMRLKKDKKGTCLQCENWSINRHILFPTDFSQNADLAFTFLEELAKTGVEKITLLHVQDNSKISPHLDYKLEEFNRIDRERLEKMRSKLKDVKDVDIEIVYGIPVLEILRIIKERNVSQVLMGSQGRGFVYDIFVGSVSYQIARMSPVPVLFIPMKRE